MTDDLVTHWIDGKAWDGAPARTGDVFDPATGAVARQVALAGRAEIDAAIASAARAARVGLDVDRPAGRGPLRVPGAARGPQGRARANHQRRARQGRERRAGRG